MIDLREDLLSADEAIVFHYLQNFPEEFITEMEVARRADGKGHFVSDSHWAHSALVQLVDQRLLETDGTGKYRIKSATSLRKAAPKKYLSPQMREILEHGNRELDLSDYF